MLGFLFVDEDSFALDPADAAKLVETDDGQTVVREGNPKVYIARVDW